jgi:mono/diheme cytochrome c family protein
MKRILIVLFFGFSVFPLGLSAQQQLSAGSSLTDQQVLGRRVFRQRCAVCHLPPVPGARVYGPSLYKELIIGNEEAILGFIMDGSKGKMPGFKYGLDRSEVDAIVDYLKTVEKTAPKKPDTSGGVIVND